LRNAVHRFFVPTSALQGPFAILTGEQAHQIKRVLRLHPGDRVMLLDNQGSVYEAALVDYLPDGIRFQVESQKPATGEPATHLTLCQAALKGERFEWVLQKGTEIGVSRFVPIICARNVVDDLRAIAQKRARWERIILEATEQCGRGRLPELTDPQPFTDAIAANPFAAERSRAQESLVAQPPALRLIAWEELRNSPQGESRLATALRARNLRVGMRIQVFVGPEGGFTAAEIDLAHHHGLEPVSLGPRTLRAETAGVVVAAAILYEVGEI
jgi:16S rRNA (uracil1498-N3)-methyltransferase